MISRKKLKSIKQFLPLLKATIYLVFVVLVVIELIIEDDIPVYSVFITLVACYYLLGESTEQLKLFLNRNTLAEST